MDDKDEGMTTLRRVNSTKDVLQFDDVSRSVHSALCDNNNILQVALGNNVDNWRVRGQVDRGWELNLNV